MNWEMMIEFYEEYNSDFEKFIKDASNEEE